MNIPFHIIQFLITNGQLNLPGLGNFYVKKKEGYFDEKTEIIYPPKEIIEFESSFRKDPHQDQLLLHYICEEKNISESSAKYILEKYIEDLKAALLEKGAVNIPELGNLLLKNNVVKFKAEEQGIVNHSNFGLPQLPFKLSATLNKLSKEAETYSLAEQALNASQNEDLENEPQPKSKKWLFILLPLLLIGMGIGAVYYLNPDLYFSTLQKIQNLTVPPVSDKKTEPVLTQEEKDILIADSIYQQDIESNLKAQGFDVEPVKDSLDITIEKTNIPNASQTRYEIIVASWKTRAKAEENVNTLKAHNINAHIVEEENNKWLRISVGSFTDFDEAVKELAKVKKEINREAKIQTITPLN
jgi:cell division protein FtsN/nucleoid DNA-binding protein